jgi:thymidylate synthase ThyX
MEGLFEVYDALSQRTYEYLAEITPRPEQMKPDAYERTLRARAFDISRYLLPLGTNTSLGEIVNARTLESQIAHLLSHTHEEIRNLGELLKNAALSPAYNVNREALEQLVAEIRTVSPDLAGKAEEQLLREVRVAPTLVKYANPNPYEIQTRRALQQAAVELMGRTQIAPAKLVDLLDEEPLEVELASSLLYEHCHYPYRQIRQAVQAAGEKIRREIIDLGLSHRGPHDEMLRPFCAGQQFRFDILMDIGGFRDMHRHRRCVQIGQGFTARHGYDTPPEIDAAGARLGYDAAMKQAAAAVEQIARRPGEETLENSQYLIPLGYRKRTLFKMDFAEVVYISELRTGPAGHMSYRSVAYAMYEAIARRYPSLEKYFRVHDVKEPVDLLKR